MASCENANNALNAEWYDRFQPYYDGHRRQSTATKKYRDCMEFDFGVMFIEDHNENRNYKDASGKPDKALYTSANVFAYNTNGEEDRNYVSNPYYKQYAVANMGNDKKNRNVYLTRLGDGQSRSYSYTSNNVLTITNVLTNVRTDNNATEIYKGSSYTATLAATTGSITNVSITMGNTDITSTAYDSNTQTISIANVTGALVISATAGGGTYTNQIPISTDVDGSIYNTTGYKTASRIKSNGTAVDNTGGTYGTFVTGFIPIQQGDIIRLYNCWQDPDGTLAEYGMDYGGLNNGFFGSDKTTLNASEFWGYNHNFGDFVYDTNGNIVQMTVKVSVPYVRLTLSGTASEAIVTINETVS